MLTINNQSSQYQGIAKIKDSSLANQSRQTKTTCKPKIERLQPFAEKKNQNWATARFFSDQMHICPSSTLSGNNLFRFFKKTASKDFFSIQFCSKESAAHPLWAANQTDWVLSSQISEKQLFDEVGTDHPKTLKFQISKKNFWQVKNRAYYRIKNFSGAFVGKKSVGEVAAAPNPKQSKN